MNLRVNVYYHRISNSKILNSNIFNLKQNILNYEQIPTIVDSQSNIDKIFIKEMLVSLSISRQLWASSSWCISTYIIFLKGTLEKYVAI